MQATLHLLGITGNPIGTHHLTGGCQDISKLDSKVHQDRLYHYEQGHVADLSSYLEDISNLLDLQGLHRSRNTGS